MCLQLRRVARFQLSGMYTQQIRAYDPPPHIVVEDICPYPKYTWMKITGHDRSCFLIRI